MKRILMTLAMTFFSTSIMQAQSERIPADLPMTSVHPFQFISVQGQAPRADRLKPDAPIPVLPGIQDGPLPCPAGIGKPCPLLGGRLYFRDPSHMTEHDATWGQAIRNPMMMVGGLANLASTIADIEGTEACLRSHTCTEGDPLFGTNPSRVKSYGIGIPITYSRISRLARVVIFSSPATGRDRRIKSLPKSRRKLSTVCGPNTRCRRASLCCGRSQP